MKSDKIYSILHSFSRISPPCDEPLVEIKSCETSLCDLQLKPETVTTVPEIENWSEWSTCSKSCDLGNRVRRKISQENEEAESELCFIEACEVCECETVKGEL